MATSPNYGWLEPDNTDLVKNGALAIRTLGNAIDTTMATMTPKSIVNAKGDLITATANDTPSIISVGANGETLVANSSTSTGLGWNANYAAGKNKIINGDFGIWQRGTSFTLAPSFVYTSDRWFAGGFCTVSRQTFTPGTAPVAGYEGQFFARWDITANSQNYEFIQRIENARTLAGQTATVSFWAKLNSGSTTFAVNAAQNFGSGGSPSSQVQLSGLGVFTPTASWQRFTFTISVPSVSGKTFGTNNDSFLFVGFQATNTATGALDIWGVQVEAGSVATAFQTATGTIQGELAACQRYYYRANATGSYSRFGLSQAISTTQATVVVPFPVVMRTRPTALEQSGAAGNYAVVNAGASSSLTCTSVPTYDTANTQTASVTFVVASGLVAGNAAQVVDNNSSSAYLGWSAEL
jgi:hypothetical protein